MSEEKPEVKEPKKLQPVEVLVDPEETNLEAIPIARVVKEPMVHQVGRNALGFAMAFMAERLANVTYDQVLRLVRSRKTL